MMTNKILAKGVLLGLFFTVCLPRLSDGFNTKAHDKLSRLAVDPTLSSFQDHARFAGHLHALFQPALPHENE